MAALPENWEWDYDGERERWFYRYKPTGITQFHFPQPGDEFPQTVDDSAPIDLEPEERLVSQLQVKRRSTVGERTSTAKPKNTLASATIAEDDDGSNAPWFQPDVFMYMGPGVYDDISPLQDDENDLPTKEEPKTTQEKPLVAASAPAPTPSPAPPSTSHVSPQQSTISPLVSAQTTPLVVQSLPAIESPPVIESPPPVRNQYAVQRQNIAEAQSLAHPHAVQTQSIVQNPPRATQEIDSAQIVEVHGESAPVVDSIRLLDSRQVAYTPVGFVAELPSEFTGQCQEDINPAPVELPGNDIMMDSGPPLLYANAFPLAPSELHSDAIPTSRRQRQGGTEQKALASGSPGFDTHRQQPSAYTPDYQPPADAYRPPLRQSSMPQPALTSARLDSTNDPHQGQYRPWNPAMNAVAEEIAKQPPAGENKRHSLAGPPPSNGRWPEIPAAMSAPMVSPKNPADSAKENIPPFIPGYGARHESISAPAQPGNASGLTHVPSVLQPARGRPVLPKSRPQSQSPPNRSPPSHSTDTNQRYTAYKPTSWDLQRDIEETVEMLSKTGYGQTAAADPEDPDRPALPRTSTAPGGSMTGSYYGMRPQIAPSIPSAPSALLNVKSQPALSYHYNISEASTTRSSDFSAPLPPSSPDLPQPLKIIRKSPPPTALQNHLPTVSSTLRPPVPPTEVYIVSRETTPAPPDTQMASVPTASMPEIQAGRPQEPISPPQTPPVLSRRTTIISPEPPSLSFSARTSTWGEGQKESGPANPLTAVAETLTKIHSDPIAAPILSSNTNVYTLDRPYMTRSQDAAMDVVAAPQELPPRESSLHVDQGQHTLRINKRQSSPPSAGTAPWQSHYFQTGSAGNSLLQPGPHSRGVMQSQTLPQTSNQYASAGAAAQQSPPRPPKTPHTPESRSSDLDIPSSKSVTSRAPARPRTPGEVPYVLPPGHHPLSSHPVNLSCLPRSRAPVSTKPTHEVTRADYPPPSTSKNNRYSMLIDPGTSLGSSKEPPWPTRSPLGSEKSTPLTSKRWSMVRSPPMPQPSSTTWAPTHQQSVGNASKQQAFNIDERVPPELVPQRTASLRRPTPQPNRSSLEIPEGPPPPQKYTAYTPPTSPPSTNVAPPLGSQFHSASSQPQPFAQPIPRAMASPPPQQESKGSFFGIGKLFRSDSLRKGGSSSPGTKLQKNAAKNGPPAQMNTRHQQQQQQQQASGRTLHMTAQVQHHPTQPSHHMRQNSQPLLQYPPFPQQQQWQSFNGGIPGVNSGPPVQGSQGGPFFANSTGDGSSFGGVGSGGFQRPFSMMVVPSAGAPTRPPPPVTDNSHDGAGWGYHYR
ncbi:hypothetical protein QBC40DRAFT_13197 [Triangularia verruculosa]|uniref:WW domain-containing protein n=1 Tax=Triangularia verruculosa TaxID=2587418 RepID=A0AAN6XR53_9PEZI|nr:hypothetical protein QBC40DRAFT_13197 [Triangularia verruculosa]